MSLTLYNCLYPSFCDPKSVSGCTVQRAGPICMLCENGYGATKSGADCTECADKKNNDATFALFGILFVVVVFVAYSLVIKRTLNILKHLENDWGPIMYTGKRITQADRIRESHVLADGNSFVNERGDMVKRPVWEGSRRLPSIMPKLKMLIGVFQILTSPFAQRV